MPQTQRRVMTDVKAVLSHALGLPERVLELTGSTPLLGNLPELDSMAVVTVITELEEQFGFVIDDDDLVSDAFETLDTLTLFVTQKLPPEV